MNARDEKLTGELVDAISEDYRAMLARQIKSFAPRFSNPGLVPMGEVVAALLSLAVKAGISTGMPESLILELVQDALPEAHEGRRDFETAMARMAKGGAA